ncbi:MAG: hypothetical protein COA61_008010 [Zetaproteobacteria bacterium]|nr:hypothetical protein [Zetaproteobacteria bacterium]
MTIELSDFEKKKERKFIRIRIAMIIILVGGLMFFSTLQFEMGGHGAKSIGQVYEIFLGGLMVFAGGSGIGATTLFLRLLRKGKKKSW